MAVVETAYRTKVKQAEFKARAFHCNTQTQGCPQAVFPFCLPYPEVRQTEFECLQLFHLVPVLPEFFPGNFQFKLEWIGLAVAESARLGTWLMPLLGMPPSGKLANEDPRHAIISLLIVKKGMPATKCSTCGKKIPP